MPDSYIGRDGLTHQYTKIDWDEKTKVSTFPTMPRKELNKLMKDVRAYQQSCLKRILSVNPALAGEQYEGFVIRDYEKKELRWDVELWKGRLEIENPLTGTFLPDAVMILEKREEEFNNNNLDLKTPQVKK